MSAGLLLAGSLGLALGACGADAPAVPPLGADGSEPNGLSCVPSEAARSTLAKIEFRAESGLARRPGGLIPVTLVPLGRSPEPLEVVADALAVKLTDQALCSIDMVDAAVGRAGASLVRVDLTTHTAVVRFAPERSDSLSALAGQLATIDGVSRVRFARVAHGAGEDEEQPAPELDWRSLDKVHEHQVGIHRGMPATPSSSACAHSQELDTPSMWHLASMRMAGAWQRQPSAAPIVVAVLDTGLSRGSDGRALAPGLEETELLPGYDFVNLDHDPADDNGHGTLVAGVIASAGALAGVAPGAALLPVKVLDAARKGDEAALIDGIRFAAAQGADVISLSLAFPTSFVPSPDLARAIEEAAAAGVVLVAASGNHGRGEVSYPAAFGEVIAVGAARLARPLKPVSLECALANASSFVASKMERAEYSGFGGPMDVCGPGGSMDHDLDHDGRPDAVPAYGFAPAAPAEFEPYLIAGTSPASAAVAGVSALLLAAGAEPGDVRALLQANAREIGDAPFETGCGRGLVDARKSLQRLEQGRIPALPSRFVNPIVTLATDNQGNRRGLALVEVVDEQNQPVVGATVVGHFRGATVHDVTATTDQQGRVLMTSLAAHPTAAIVELTIDAILEPAADGSLQAIVPHSFARFESATFRWLASFQAEGGGIEPVPWSIAIDPDAIAAYVGEFELGMVHGADPSPPLRQPLSTVPFDVGSWVIRPTLFTRTLGGDRAPTTVAIDRQAIVTDCQLSDDLLPIVLGGAGIEPVPWRLNESLLRDPITVSEVLVRADGLFEDGQPATESSLELVFGAQGRVLIRVQDSICEPHSVVMADLSVLSDAILDGLPVDDGGYHIEVDTDAAPPPPADGAVPLDATALGAGLVEVPFATDGPAWTATAAVGDDDGSGVQPW